MKRKTILSLLCIAAGAAVLSFASVSDSLAAKAKSKGVICPAVYIPVCAVKRGGLPTTYSNTCTARVAGARVLHAGECAGPICLPFVKTVCAIDPKTGKRRDYNNLCYAENAQATFVKNGSCKGSR